ncbi:uncharacterized protein MONOS_18250 [Monocercomonoides exilis]|uniref:uncharacterized protein n=1 Tax=Monocercomonoides exilis TaxID=2049356 RepID=UPI00355A8F57|nr:hypothetical protein MONOS_18250 [Monocercomonoides exilis]
MRSKPVTKDLQESIRDSHEAMTNPASVMLISLDANGTRKRDRSAFTNIFRCTGEIKREQKRRHAPFRLYTASFSTNKCAFNPRRACWSKRLAIEQKSIPSTAQRRVPSCAAEENLNIAFSELLEETDKNFWSNSFRISADSSKASVLPAEPELIFSVPLQNDAQRKMSEPHTSISKPLGWMQELENMSFLIPFIPE